MTELLDDLERMGEDKAWSLVEKRWRGLSRLRSRLGDANLDFAEFGGFELFREEEEEQFHACMDRLDTFNEMLEGITGRKDIFVPADDRIREFGFRNVRRLIWNRAEGQLHAGKMIEGLLRQARGLGVYVLTGMAVDSLEDRERFVELKAGPGWTLQARRVLVATNGFARELLPALPVHPARNQVMLTVPVPGIRIRGTFHYDRGYYYFRDVDGRLLLGGGRNLAESEEQTPELGTTPLIRAALSRLLKEVILPGQSVGIDRWWSGVLGVGGEKVPVVERVSSNIAVAVRMGGMGVAIGTLVGEQGAGLLLEM